MRPRPASAPRRGEEALPEGATEGDFMFVEQTLAVRTGMVTRAVRRATTAGFQQPVLAVRQAEHQHSVVQQRQQHRQQRAFLSAVQAGGRGEHAGWLADQLAGQPQAAGAVEEVFQGSRHIAEASGAT